MNSLDLVTNHDQIEQIFVNELILPIEITTIVFSHLSIPYLHETLGATLEQLLVYVRKIGYKKFKSQMLEIVGYCFEEDDGSLVTFCETDVSFVFKFRMTAKIQISRILIIGSFAIQFTCNAFSNALKPRLSNI